MLSVTLCLAALAAALVLCGPLVVKAVDMFAERGVAHAVNAARSHVKVLRCVTVCDKHAVCL